MGGTGRKEGGRTVPIGSTQPLSKPVNTLATDRRTGDDDSDDDDDEEEEDDDDDEEEVEEEEEEEEDEVEPFL